MSIRMFIRTGNKIQHYAIITKLFKNLSKRNISDEKNLKLNNDKILSLKNITNEWIIKKSTTNCNVNRFTIRNINCGELNEKLIGKKVQLCGWLEFQRMNRFAVLRDSYGKIQLLIKNKENEKIISKCHFESVIKIIGIVAYRPEKDINPNMMNGNLEIIVENIELLNNSKANMPFLPLRDSIMSTNENLRLKYRYIDIRRTKMINILRLRSSMLMAIRNCLVENYGFVEVETPTLFKDTPGGAQEFIVPTRFKDQYYNLVQSPQQFKQLLMIGGIDRYFQVARCYRDEGTKSDRQPEFTQLDIEMSFTTINDIMELIEDLLRNCWPIELEKHKIDCTFQKITYNDSINNYGTDKPDLRESNIKIQHKYLNNNNKYYYQIIIPQNYDQNFLIKNFIENELNLLKNLLNFNGKLFHFKYSSLIIQKNILDDDIFNELNDKHNNSYHDNDYIFLAYDDEQFNCLDILGRIRASCIDIIENNNNNDDDIDLKRKLSFCWVYDFPLFSNDNEQLKPEHHPFTAPNMDDISLLYTNPEKCRGQSFDLVINGREIGGGSIRIHSYELQQYILNNILNCRSKSMDYFLDALQCGCPPHGGIALGIDRLIALICQQKSLRDVIAFPKSANGKDLMSNSQID